jgi:hypothetical protein
MILILTVNINDTYLPCHGRFFVDQYKAVPLRAMEAFRGRGDIAPTHSRPRHKMGWMVSITPRPLFTPGERTPGTHWRGGWVGPRAGLDTEDRGKILCPCRGSNPDRPVVHPVVRHYTDWANPVPIDQYRPFISLFIVYFATLFQKLRLKSVKWQVNECMVNWNGFWTKWSWPNFRELPLAFAGIDGRKP